MVVVMIAIISTAVLVQANTPPASFGEVSLVKVHPGMNDNYLATLKITKKVNNNLKKAKTISSWQLYKRVYPVRGSLDFNFSTFTVFASGKKLNSLTDLSGYEVAAKELKVKEHQASIGTLPSIRKVVGRDPYAFKMNAGTSGVSKAGDYVLLSRIKANTGSLEAYEKTLEMLNPFLDEAKKVGKLKGWNEWKRAIATNIDGASDYTIDFAFNNMDEALSYSSGKVDLITEFKKVYPKEDYPAFCAKQIALRELVTQ